MLNAKIFFLIGLIACLNGHAFSLSCKNEKGEDVDWFVLYKPPKQQNDNPILAAGGGYGYIDYKSSESDWLLAEHDIGDKESVIGQTFEEVYAKPDDYSYIQYNDAKPEEGKDSIIYAHAKGALVWNNKDAVYIVHSTPKFLPTFHTKNYEYPKGGKIHGQNFLCITLDPKENVNKILSHLIRIKAQIYGNHVSKKLNKELSEEIEENMGHIDGKKSIEPKEPVEKITKEVLAEAKQEIVSKGGEKFMIVTKSRKYQFDVWKIVQKLVKAKDMIVKSWTLLQKKEALMESECQLENTLNAQDMKMKFSNSDETLTWGKNDHSKLSLCVNGGNNCFCAGDMNRAQTQLKRGGGAVCFSNKALHKTVHNTISTTLSCSNELVENKKK